MLPSLFLVLMLVLCSGSSGYSVADQYAPKLAYCPSDDINLVREASGLSQNETQWLQRRDVRTKEALHNFLQRATSSSQNFTQLFHRIFDAGMVPRIGIAVSGGGYRSMLTGAGILSAFDNRTRGAMDHGLGGILQSTTYMTGCSGGNWLVASLSWNNWTSVQDILDMNYDRKTARKQGKITKDPIWDLSDSIVSPGGLNIIKTARRWDHITNAVKAKQEAGFNTSLADVWGRALSYKFFPTLERGGIDYTWSSLRDSPIFQAGDMPLPITVADGRYPGSNAIALNATVFEFNPFEMGSWDPSLNAFTDVKYLGTNVTNGKPVAHTAKKCIEGFDNTAFIMGTSSNLFNQFLLRINSTHLPNFVTKWATNLLKSWAHEFNDVAVYNPNPFKDTRYVMENFSTSIVDSEHLYLVDGGEDDENVPLIPLLQRDRDLDIIFAIDNSADNKLQWPDGSSLVHTYERQFVLQGQKIAFPHIPDTNTFINLGLNKRPTFFGCNATNMTSLKYIPPLVVYYPNSEYSFNSNQSAFKLSYSRDQMANMISNGFEIATRNNFTDDPEFIGCIACAIMKRKQEALDLELPSECERCLARYCWDGTVDDTPLDELKQDVHHSFINPEEDKDGDGIDDYSDEDFTDDDVDDYHFFHYSNVDEIHHAATYTGKLLPTGAIDKGSNKPLINLSSKLGIPATSIAYAIVTFICTLSASLL